MKNDLINFYKNDVQLKSAKLSIPVTMRHKLDGLSVDTKLSHYFLYIDLSIFVWNDSWVAMIFELFIMLSFHERVYIYF